MFYIPFQNGNKRVNNHELKGVYLSVIYCVGWWTYATIVTNYEQSLKIRVKEKKIK